MRRFQVDMNEPRLVSSTEGHPGVEVGDQVIFWDPDAAEVLVTVSGVYPSAHQANRWLVCGQPTLVPPTADDIRRGQELAREHGWTEERW